MPIRLKSERELRRLTIGAGPMLGRVEAGSGWIEVTLPCPPSANQLYHVWQGRIRLTTEAREYRKTVEAVLAAYLVQPMLGRLVANVTLFPPAERAKYDLDNAMKILFDALSKGNAARAMKDDSQIVRIVADKMPGEPGGKVIVRLEYAA